MNNVKAKIEEYCTRLKEVLDSLDTEKIVVCLNVIRRAFIEGQQIFIMGNGGSAATSSHIACDLNKGVSGDLEKKFKVISLNDNVPTMLATANDISYEDIFVEQLKNFLKPGDVVIGISGSGNSKNILKAVEFANRNGGITIGLCGFDGGKLKQISQHSIHAEINDMQIAEDIHSIIGHMMMQIFKTNLKSIQKQSKQIDVKEFDRYDILLEQLCESGT
jgi:D-sedoheptulose 7-phosphate isomerase